MPMTAVHERRRLPLEFEGLESLPCGCVSVAYRTRPWDILVCSLEAKGPLCNFDAHVTGGVVQLGEPLN